ncbi:efflux RND transporter permease subunit [candidate division KSB1 bacterium]|nr:efflux RND transporter permease subunit [candidate division KSB1 bacterium]MBL7093861.1 efflux RND transporter permease subunit [candidate division KSB1 bacterium]
MLHQIEKSSPVDRIIRFSLENKLVVTLVLILIIVWGILVSPFDWEFLGLPRDPVPVDAIPDIGENQQIVFTEWMGRSPQDIEDQIGYPLTVSLLGIPGVKTIRSYSMFGFSSIYVIFKEDVEFYWSRSRVLEKLNSLSKGTLPEGVQPSLGPDATALGQVFWYTLEGQDENGNPTGGWDLQELRSIQDWHVRYSLMSAEGVSEVASIGGFVKEYQIDVDPDAMRAYNVKLAEVFAAVKMSNLDVGARTIEVNKVEYVVRGVGFVKEVGDLENAVIKVNDNVPIYIKNIAHVTLGPAMRRGALDKNGAEVVGGVVVVRYGENPLRVIKNVKDKIAEISAGLPKKTLQDDSVSQVKIVPFYDRTKLINETLDTLNTALAHEILITIIVILVLIMHFRGSILISGLLPIAVLMVFIAMKHLGVDANIVALSGIAIAIGTMVDLGIIMSENIVRHLNEAEPEEDRLEIIYQAAKEVSGAILTAVSTTIVSFLPVFTMQAAEGKLFKPLAFTKTFALISAVFVALIIIPPFAHVLFTGKISNRKMRYGMNIALIILGIISIFVISWWIGLILLLFGIFNFVKRYVPATQNKWLPWISNGFVIFVVVILLSTDWLPLGPEKGWFLNVLFVGLLIGLFLFFFHLFVKHYGQILNWALNNKKTFLAIPLTILFLGLLVWLGFETFFGWLPKPVKVFKPVSYIAHKFPGMGKEFMPSLDEGSYLLMPTTMPHASIGEVLDVLQKQDMAINAIPEVSLAVGKLGRAESPLDPAPISMIETVINYYSEFLEDENGERLKFQHDPDSTDFVRSKEGVLLLAPDGEPYFVRGAFIRKKNNELIVDSRGRPFRLWRSALDPALNEGRTAWAGINNPADIWDEIIKAAEIPGTTSAPMLQPISTRIVMLQSGMRAPIGMKVKGPNLETIEKVGLQLENLLKNVPSIDAATVLADRIVGKPYLEIHIDRQAIARYGIKLNQVQEVIEVAIGGKRITTTVEGRERYPVRIRYMRELRDNFEAIEKILVPAPDGAQIPLIQLAEFKYRRGAQMIKSEDTFLVGYVIFDKKPGYGEVDVVEQAHDYLNQKMEDGEFKLPAGVSYTFAGSYENQVRAQKRLSIILPLALFVIFIILYFQFKSVSTTALVFTSIAVAWAGGFIMLWLYGQSWFLDFSLTGVNLRELFHIRAFNLSVAVWVGFIALFGIATDDGVMIATYLKQIFEKKNPKTINEIREATILAGKRRVRPAVMTTATTVLALIPVLTATGRGADIMVPMAIPSFGGMIFEMITMFVVPVLYAAIKERRLKI